MIELIGIALALQAAPSGPLSTQSFTVSTPSVSFPEAVLPMVEEYTHCLSPSTPVSRDPRKTNLEAAQERIAACKPTWDWAVAASARIMATSSKNSLEEAASIFQSQDAAWLANARFMDRLEAGEATLPADPNAVIELPVDEKPDAGNH